MTGRFDDHFLFFFFDLGKLLVHYWTGLGSLEEDSTLRLTLDPADGWTDGRMDSGFAPGKKVLDTLKVNYGIGRLCCVMPCDAMLSWVLPYSAKLGSTRQAYTGLRWH